VSIIQILIFALAQIQSVIKEKEVFIA